MPGPSDGETEFEHCSDIRQKSILQYLKDNGERLDSEIAAEMGDSLESICQCLSELSSRGDVIMCHTTRYNDGNVIEGTLCRASGYFRMATRGRKPGAAVKKE